MHQQTASSQAAADGFTAPAFLAAVFVHVLSLDPVTWC